MNNQPPVEKSVYIDSIYLSSRAGLTKLKTTTMIRRISCLHG